MKTTRAQHDEFCEWCGYPFDNGDKCYDVSGDGFPIVCSKRCAEQIVAHRPDRYSHRWLHNPAN